MLGCVGVCMCVCTRMCMRTSIFSPSVCENILFLNRSASLFLDFHYPVARYSFSRAVRNRSPNSKTNETEGMKARPETSPVASDQAWEVLRSALSARPVHIKPADEARPVLQE